MRQSLATENLLKMTKNVFYFTLKAIFVLKIFICLCWIFGHIENGLIKKIRLISKFITSQPGKQTIAIQILSKISRSKDNQTTKFGKLIAYNMRHIFPENSYKKCSGEAIPRPFPKKSKLSIFLDQ